MSSERSVSRYTSVAIVLHWTTALLVIAMVPMGWWMVDAINEPASQQTAYQAFQLHKSIGFAILALTLARLAWRLTHPTPALPSGMRWWEVFLARATHVCFYGILVALPLTGWIYVSTGWAAALDRPLSVATSWFGLFTVPHLPGIEGQRDVAFGAIGAHELLVWAGIVLLALHVGAALKHQFIDRDGVLAQMIPLLGRGNKPHGGAVSGGWRAFATAAGLAAVIIVTATGWSRNQPAPLAEAAPTPAVSASAEPAPATQAAAVTEAPAPGATTGTAKAWTIDKSASSIAFSGTHTGNAFEGRFEQWDGDIRFDPADLANSSVSVLIDTASARTGDATQENSLQTDEWFNPARFPQARFEAATFRAIGDDRYEAEGTLTIKDKLFPVVLPFRLTIDDTVATMEGELELDRTALDLGMFSDPAAGWVSQAIAVKVKVRATPR